ncbi:hypothetical protein HDV06_001005 [Boothiomyces sp. JEL0866]|nr:hypothetical protein HDV06_001005 [Boothiomyces sp. JEL0866]
MTPIDEPSSTLFCPAPVNRTTRSLTEKNLNLDGVVIKRQAVTFPMHRQILLFVSVTAIKYDGFDLTNDGKGVVYANWCDFKNWFYKQTSSSDRDCGPKCQQDNDCTHFTFDPIHEQCFFKNGPVEKDTIIQSSLPQNQQNWMMPVCGFILDRNPQCPIVGDSIICNELPKAPPAPTPPPKSSGNGSGAPSQNGGTSSGNNGNPQNSNNGPNSGNSNGNSGSTNPNSGQTNPSSSGGSKSPGSGNDDPNTRHSSPTESPMTIKVVGAIANSPQTTLNISPSSSPAVLSNTPLAPLTPPVFQSTPASSGVNIPLVAGVTFGIIIAGVAIAMYAAKRDGFRKQKDQNSLIDLYSQLPPVKPIPLAGPPKSILRKSNLYSLNSQSTADLERINTISVGSEIEPETECAVPQTETSIDFNFPPPPNGSNSSLNNQQVDDFVKSAKQSELVPEKSLYFKQKKESDGKMLSTIPLVPIRKE